MSEQKNLTTKVTKENYDKMQEFLQKYNERTGEDLTMSKLVWKAIKVFVNGTLKSWGGR